MGHAYSLFFEPRKRRCRFGGGVSTCPISPKGRERVAAAHRRRSCQSMSAN